jgi:hypothetical protein
VGQVIQVIHNGKVMYEFSPQEATSFIKNNCSDISDPDGAVSAVLGGSIFPFNGPGGPEENFFRLKEETGG